MGGQSRYSYFTQAFGVINQSKIQNQDFFIFIFM
jgi:hypothetical protein